MMGFPNSLYLYALCGGFIVSYATLPPLSRLCQKWGLVDQPGHRKIHDSVIPLAGGLALFCGLIIPLLVGALSLAFVPSAPAYAQMQYGLAHRATPLAGMVGGGLIMLLAGLADDLFELKPLAKFSLQLLAAFLVAFSGVRITLFVPFPPINYAITVLFILTVTNAFNFMDNMNGLCAGMGCIAALCLAVIAMTAGQYLVAGMAWLICGSALGFLPHNFPKASAFLGDSGSHLVGYLMAILAIIPHYYTRRHPHAAAVLVPLVVLAVPLFDLVQVVIVRWKLGRPFYVGDTNHISHRLARSGRTRVQTVMIIWACCFLAGTCALLLYMF